MRFSEKFMPWYELKFAIVINNLVTFTRYDGSVYDVSAYNISVYEWSVERDPKSSPCLRYWEGVRQNEIHRSRGVFSMSIKVARSFTRVNIWKDDVVRVFFDRVPPPRPPQTRRRSSRLQN